jgi:probable F420-dependent oxidoreductase
MPYWLDRPPLEALEIGRAADAGGYDSLWVGEMMTFDAFALAGALARETERVRLVVGPLAAPLRSPASLALGIASVAALGGRPAGLALGASTPAVVEAWHGRRWQPVAAQMRETIEALRPILAGERSSYAGKHVRSGGFRLAGGAAEGVSVAVAAFGPRMVRLAAEMADRVVVNLLSPAQAGRIAEGVRTAARAAGREPPPLTAWVPVALDPGDGAYAQLARQLVLYLGAPGYGEMFAEAGHGGLVALARSGAHPKDVLAAVTPAVIESIALCGTVGALEVGLEAYAAAGIDEVAIVPVTAEDPGGRRLLAALGS